MKKYTLIYYTTLEGLGFRVAITYMVFATVIYSTIGFGLRV